MRFRLAIQRRAAQGHRVCGLRSLVVFLEILDRHGFEPRGAEPVREAGLLNGDALGGCKRERVSSKREDNSNDCLATELEMADEGLRKVLVCE